MKEPWAEGNSWYENIKSKAFSFFSMFEKALLIKYRLENKKLLFNP